MSVFRAYDVRGTYPDQINEDIAYKVGRAFVLFTKAKTVVVGQDMRTSSPKLFDALAKGITDQGADVVSIGMCTTPMLGFCVGNYKYDGGIMISASHNPAQYNGLKLIQHPMFQLSANYGMKEIEDLVQKNEFHEANKGSISEKEILNDYLEHHLGFAKGIKELSVVVDYGNGVGSISAKPLFEKLPVTLTSLYEEPDGNFPNHPADPHHKENFEDLQKAVKEKNADLGIFFDGDADRSYFVDHEGNIVFADLLLAVLAENELEHHPNEKVYYDLRFSKAVKDAIQEHSGTPIMMRVGNPFYKEKLIKEGGVLAGELSGHIMFKENFFLDDGLFAAIKVMSIMSKTQKALKDLIAPIQKYATSEEINLSVADADQTLQAVKAAYPDGESIDLDGIYIQYENWWFNLRKSNTEPVVRLRIEANTEELLEEKKNQLLQIIQG